MDWVNAVVQGVLLGGLYALFATGLSLVFGIMRVVNLAHGDFIILAAFLGVAVVGLTGVSPFLGLLVVVPVMLGLGYAITLTDLVLAPFTPSNTARSAGTIFPVLRSIPELYGSRPGESPRKIGASVCPITSAPRTPSVVPATKR